MSVEFTDNSETFLSALEEATQTALENVGLAAEGYAKKLCPVDMGALRNSISHRVAENEVHIGTNNEYAAYVEMGTGKYDPGGRQEPWAYKDAKGNWHRTEGQKAKPFLKPAATKHTGEYRKIIKQTLENA